MILIKQDPCVQLAHLYEHLFLMRVNDFFYQHKLYKMLDYAVHGTAYEQAGIIAVECEFYTPEAQALAAEISELHIELGADNVNLSQSFHQIMAEEQHDFVVADKQKIIDRLLQLDTTPWQSLDNVAYIDTSAVRRSSSPLRLDTSSTVPTKTLKIILGLDPQFASSHRHLAPLTNKLHRVLSLTIAPILAARYGLYPGEVYARGTVTTNELMVNRELERDIDINELQRVAVDILAYMATPETFARLINNAAHISDTHHLYASPDYERLLIETGVLVGSRGWRDTTTTYNLRQAYNHSTLMIRYGRHKTAEVVLP